MSDRLAQARSADAVSPQTSATKRADQIQWGIVMTMQASTQQQLRQFIEQIERLEEEKKATAGDIRDKYAEAKALGFDPKVMRKIVSLRKRSHTDRMEEEAVLVTYMHALGMVDDAPAGASPMLDAAE